jgi:CRISPR-associated protein Cmr5
MLQTRSQQLARQIYPQVYEVKDWSDREQRARYGMLCNRLAFLVLENGLVQALGFLEAKARSNSGEPERTLLAHVAQILETDAEQLTKDVREAGLGQYRNWTRRILEACVWYKRFAQSLLGVGPEGSTEETDDAENDA